VDKDEDEEGQPPEDPGLIEQNNIWRLLKIRGAICFIFSNLVLIF
jgi:hypothetical protein